MNSTNNKNMNSIAKTLLLVVPAFVLALPATLLAATFSDDFSTGLNPSYWSFNSSAPGVYSVDATHGDVRLAKVAATTGDQGGQVFLNLASTFGGPIVGDFSSQVSFSNPVFGSGGSGQDEMQLNIYLSNNADPFADISSTAYKFDVYDNGGGLNYHVYDNLAGHGNHPTAATSGTFSIVRTGGNTITAYFNGDPFFTQTNGNLTAPLAAISFSLENQPNDAGGSPSVTFDNFSLTGTAAAPEPSSAILLLSGAALCLCRRSLRTNCRNA